MHERRRNTQVFRGQMDIGETERRLSRRGRNNGRKNVIADNRVYRLKNRP
ncbi:hypothetical protein WN51_12261 [Melipona quadrifasciata]|uniref:Uncharacterized protein n=1 Tax=Melipona quadrifasciata TaxID=166423 RepID=A0A0M9A1W5_9HYME|nr:hypothetical protein WN51_12261 [Melipona quadrifasciata]